MKRLFFLLLLATMGCATSAAAKSTVDCEIEKLSQHARLVTFVWKANIQADKNWDACDLIISFRDEKGGEVYRVKERLELKIGSNVFTGNEICELKVWQAMRKYVTKLDCVF